MRLNERTGNENNFERLVRFRCRVHAPNWRTLICHGSSLLGGRWLLLGEFRIMLLDNELLYIVEGVDPSGRKFRGLYNKADAEYLAASHCLNRIVGTVTSS